MHAGNSISKALGNPNFLDYFYLGYRFLFHPHYPSPCSSPKRRGDGVLVIFIVGSLDDTYAFAGISVCFELI